MKDWEKNVTMRVKTWLKIRKKPKTLSVFEREALDWVNKKSGAIIPRQWIAPI